MKRLPHWVLTDTFPAFYDSESATAIEQTAKLYGAMQELIDEYNQFVDDVNAHIEEYETNMNADFETFKANVNATMYAFIASINSKINEQDTKINEQDTKINDTIDYIKNTLLKRTEELILYTETMQQQIDQLVIEGDSSVEAAQARVSTDENSVSTTYTTLKNRLDTEHNNLNNRFDEEHTYLSTKLDKLSNISVTALRKTKDFSLYQAKVNNPLSNIAYSNEPVSLYINFDPGECKSTKCIEVFKNGTFMSHQFEVERNPNPKSDREIGLYPDGSLKSGTIWLMDSISENGSNVYTIKVHADEKGHVFTTQVTNTVISETENLREYSFTANNVVLSFNELYSFMPSDLTINDVNRMVTSPCFHRISYKNSAYSDVDTLRQDGHTEGQFVVTSNKVNGNGVVYLESETEGYFVSNENITYRNKTRMYANGMFDIESYVILKNGLDSGVLNGVVFKYGYDKTVNTLTTGSDYSFENAGNSVMLCLHDFQQTSDYNQTEYNPEFFAIANNNNVHIVQARWAYTSPKESKHREGVYWSNRMRVNPLNDNTDNDTNILKMFNRLLGVSTKKTRNELKEELLALCKTFLLNPRTLVSNFPGSNCLTNLAISYIKQEDDISRITTDFKTFITNRYEGGTSDGFYNAWVGGLGIEFIGRDASSFKHMRDKYIEIGDTENANYVTDVIHGLADAFVQMEEYAGGDGRLLLHYDNPKSLYSMNAMCAGMKALKNSLNIEENTTRQTVYNRVKTCWLATLKRHNISPQTAPQDVYFKPAYHYHCFSVSEYLCCEIPTEFSPSHHIIDGLTPSGHCREIGYQWDSEKRGFGMNNLYAASALVRTGVLTELQAALTIMEFIVSKIQPVTGFYYHPLDDWGNPVSIANNYAIDYQIVSEIFFHLMKS